jgi:hypothetical protein
MKILTKIYLVVFTTAMVLLQLQLAGQNIARTDITLTDLDGKEVVYDDILKSGERIMVVFWNSNNKKHIDFLDLLNEREINGVSDDDLHIIAICTNKFHNYQQLNNLSASKMWQISLYVDVNESFKRINGISDERLRTVMYEGGEQTVDPVEVPDLDHRNYLVQR